MPRPHANGINAENQRGRGPNPFFGDPITVCAIVDDKHVIREMHSTAPDLFRFDPVGNSRWDVIGADSTSLFWRAHKAQINAGLPFKVPPILIPFKHGTGLSKGYIRPNFRKIAGPNCGPAGTRQGYIVMSNIFQPVSRPRLIA